MQTTSRLKQLRDQILGIEMNLTLIKTDLASMQKDIEFFQDLELALLENIKILKSTGIITMASEYKKAIAELKTVQTNLKYYASMNQKLNWEYNRHIKMRTESVLEFEELTKQHENRKVVLSFDQSKRKK